MKKNNQGFSLVIAISITLIMVLLALYILEYIIPFSKNTKNIEHSVSAYYLADSAIEDALYSMSGSSLDYEKTDDLTGVKDYSITMDAKGTVLPPLSNGNSDFDKDYNILRVGDPIQIEIGNGLINNISNFEVLFNIPDIDGLSNKELAGGTLKILNWQLSSNNDILISEDTQIIADEINGFDINLGSRDGIKLDETTESFSDFYSSNCGIGNSCVLKISVINKLELTNGVKIPYLHWKISTVSEIPLRYRLIKTVGRSYGFRKSLDIRVPQQTVNEAFDFALFQ